MKHFEKNLFKNYRRKVFKQIIDLLQNTELNILNKKALFKEKPIKKLAFIIKKMSKAIMTCSCLLNKFRSEKRKQIKQTHNKQRDFSLSLVRQAEKGFFNNLNVKFITDNKTLWKIVKTYFPNKLTRHEK